jgi:hypothetical protein
MATSSPRAYYGGPQWHFQSTKHNEMPIPVAERSKAWVCSRSPAEIAGSNPAGAWMFVCCQFCFVCQVEVSATGWSLVLPTVLCHCVWSRNLKNEEAKTRKRVVKASKIIISTTKCRQSVWLILVRTLRQLCSKGNRTKIIRNRPGLYRPMANTLRSSCFICIPKRVIPDKSLRK